MIPAAIQVVGRIGGPEQAGEPQAQVPGMVRHDDVALVVDDILERRQRIAALAGRIDVAAASSPGFYGASDRSRRPHRGGGRVGGVQRLSDMRDLVRHQLVQEGEH